MSLSLLLLKKNRLTVLEWSMFDVLDFTEFGGHPGEKSDLILCAFFLFVTEHFCHHVPCHTEIGLFVAVDFPVYLELSVSGNTFVCDEECSG